VKRKVSPTSIDAAVGETLIEIAIAIDVVAVAVFDTPDSRPSASMLTTRYV
jgi:hypothetical protein